MSEATPIAEVSGQTIVSERIFDAPRDLVFKAYTDPQHIPQWWGPRRLRTVVDAMEPKSGGAWRFLNREPDGTEYAFHGIYHEMTAPERIVQTFEFEGMPGNVLLEVARFEALPDGRTRMIVIGSGVFRSADERDGLINSGMEEGSNETYDRFEELLATLQTA